MQVQYVKFGIDVLLSSPYYLVSTKSLRLTRREIQMLGICPSGFDYSVSQVSHLRSR